MEAPQEEVRVTTKEELLRDFKNGRSEVFYALAGLEHEDMTRPINDRGLTVKDLLAHWIEWDQLEIGRTGKYFAGEEILMEADLDNDAFNKKAFTKWKDKSVGDVVRAFGESTNNVERLLKGLTQQQLFSDKRGLRFREKKADGEVIIHIINPAWFLVEADHDRDHAKEIEKWKRELGINEHQQTA